MAKLQVISVCAGQCFWSFLDPEKQGSNLSSKDMFSPSSTDLPTSWEFSASSSERSILYLALLLTLVYRISVCKG